MADAFWQPDDYSREAYLEPPLTDALLAEVEAALGVALPAAYIELAREHNGGIPRRYHHRTATPTSWAPDHVAVNAIFAIGRTATLSLLGRHGSAFWIAEWGYPPIGVYFADCPSAGHDLLCLDYRACGPRGEPAIVHVDQEHAYAITPVAPDFAAFLRGLEDASAFADDEDPDA